jgi:hypothetical protein
MKATLTDALATLADAGMGLLAVNVVSAVKSLLRRADGGEVREANEEYSKHVVSD